MRNKTVENFKNDFPFYTDEMIDTLYECYTSPYNEHNDLSFGDWLYSVKEAENGTIIAELLEDFAEM